MRAAFSEALVRITRADPKQLLLTGDHGYSLFDDFRRICPDQYINAGIVEQNMVGMAAGLARTGFKPFVYGLSAFIPIRVLEQIKLDVAHDKLPVILIGDGAGFVYSHLGTSHQSTEDIACTRAIPNLSIYSPGDWFELTACMNLAYQSSSPAYIRMGKSDRGDVHNKSPHLEKGALLNVKTGSPGELLFIATGSLLRTAVDIASNDYPNSSVWSAPFIKPLNAEQLVTLCNQSRAVVVFEEHSVMGGLGSVVAETIAEFSSTRVLRVGVADRFSHYCGTYDYLLQEHGLDKAAIIKRIEAFEVSIST